MSLRATSKFGYIPRYTGNFRADDVIVSSLTDEGEGGNPNIAWRIFTDVDDNYRFKIQFTVNDGLVWQTKMYIDPSDNILVAYGFGGSSMTSAKPPIPGIDTSG
jgi:hypothetical protein